MIVSFADEDQNETKESTITSKLICQLQILQKVLFMEL